MNYLAMRDQFQGILDRTDCSDTLAKTFFGQSVQLANRDLRAPFMEQQLTVNTTAGSVSSVQIPDDYLETKTFNIDNDDDSYELDFVNVGSFQRKKNQAKWDDTPLWYTRRNPNFYITAPIKQGDTAYMVYYAENPALVNDIDEPVIAQIAPDLLITGALIFAAEYFHDDRKPAWEQDWAALKTQLEAQAQDEEDRTGSTTVQPAYEFDDGVP